MADLNQHAERFGIFIGIWAQPATIRLGSARPFDASSSRDASSGPIEVQSSGPSSVRHFLIRWSTNEPIHTRSIASCERRAAISGMTVASLFVSMFSRACGHAACAQRSQPSSERSGAWE